MPLSRITSPFQSATANVYSPSANTIAFNTSNAEVMRINSDRKVLIGTTSTTGTSNNANKLVVGDNSSATETGITLGSTAASGIRWSDGSDAGVIEYAHSDDSMRFVTNASEKIRIGTGGTVTVGGTSSTAKFAVANNTSNETTNSKQYAVFGTGTSYLNSDASNIWGAALGELQIHNGLTSRPAMLSLGGNLAAGEGLGVINFFRSENTANYRSRAQIAAGLSSSGTANQYGADLRFSTAGDGDTNPTERMRIGKDYVRVFSNIGGSSPLFCLGAEVAEYSAKCMFLEGFWLVIQGHNNEGIRFQTVNGTNTKTTRMTINGNGSVSIPGSLSKGSGSFQIEHPLPEKANTHYLVHSFIEGPQADLIYRGKVQLENGVATVNIDTASDMTEGTFEVLCRDIQCFTSNETGWDAVRGSVSGNILTIECQNPSSNAIISWMVIGERKDKHMYDTAWTDENGKVIVEPLIPSEEENVEYVPDESGLININPT